MINITKDNIEQNLGLVDDSFKNSYINSILKQNTGKEDSYIPDYLTSDTDNNGLKTCEDIADTYVLQNLNKSHRDYYNDTYGYKCKDLDECYSRSGSYRTKIRKINEELSNVWNQIINDENLPNCNISISGCNYDS